MKNLLLIAILGFGMNADAASNLFHCKGEDITLSFSKSSFIGKPSLHLERNDKTIHLQGEGSITMRQQCDGLLVTAQGNGDYVQFLIPLSDEDFSTTLKLNSPSRRSLREVAVQCKGQSVMF